MSSGMVAFLLYLFTRIDLILTAATVGFWVVFLASTVLAAIYMLVCSEANAIATSAYAGRDRKELKKKEAAHAKSVAKMLIIRSPLLYLPLLFASLAIPSQKDLVLIVGGALGYEAVQIVVSDDRVRQTGGKAFDLLDSWLDVQQHNLNRSEDEDQ